MENKKFQFHFGFGIKIKDICVLKFEEPSFQEAIRKAYKKLSHLRSSTGENWKILKVVDESYWQLKNE